MYGFGSLCSSARAAFELSRSVRLGRAGSEVLPGASTLIRSFGALQSIGARVGVGRAGSWGWVVTIKSRRPTRKYLTNLSRPRCRQGSIIQSFFVITQDFVKQV